MLSTHKIYMWPVAFYIPWKTKSVHQSINTSCHLFFRLGWFIPTDTKNKFWSEHQIILDHWQSLVLPEVAQAFSLEEDWAAITNLTFRDKAKNKHFCDTDYCDGGIFYGPGCSSSNISCALLLSSTPGMNYVFICMKFDKKDFKFVKGIELWFKDNFQFLSN